MLLSGRWRKFFEGSLRGYATWALSLFLIGLGAKFYLILKSDSPLPYYDQWDAEGVNTYIPFFGHVFSLEYLFKAHNEHRIVWTRVYDLLLVLLNGQWDSELQMTLNAIIHCAVLAGFGWLMARLMGRQYWPFIWLPLAISLVLPIAWENTLEGFQSQFYFMLLFSLLTIWLLGMNEPRSTRWKWGVATGILGLFTMASGFMAATAVAAMLLVDIARDPKIWRKHLPTLLVCAGLTLDGLLLKVDVPRHHMFLAHTLWDFESALGKNLAWPSSFAAWVVPINLLPLILLAWVYCHSHEEMRAERMILATGGWAILQGLAAAYARGGEGRAPAWRYMDLECFIMIANCLGMAVLIGRYRRRLGWMPLWYAGFVLWGVTAVSGLYVLSKWAYSTAIPTWNVRQNRRVYNTRAYVAANDPHVYYKEELIDLAYPYAPLFTTVMHDPNVRRILPACVREALRVERAGADDGAFVLNGTKLATPDPPSERSWGSYSSAGAKAQGKFESAPVPASRMAYLEIPVAGDLGEAGLSLELVDVKSGRVTEVRPAHAPGDKWTNVYVRAPAGQFKVVARDESETKWLAFKEPREMGWMSYWAKELLKTWLICLIAGGGSLVWALVKPRRQLE